MDMLKIASNEENFMPRMKNLQENKNYFLETLATNHIDFYFLKSRVSNAPIEGVFIEYKRNPS
jgi:hypothetical protein